MLEKDSSMEAGPQEACLNYDPERLGFLLDLFMVDFHDQLHKVRPGYIPRIIMPSHLLLTEELEQLPPGVKPSTDAMCQLVPLEHIKDRYKEDPELLRNIEQIYLSRLNPLLIILEHEVRPRALVVPLFYNLQRGANPKA